MAPRRDEISPSMAERDLLTSEPALIESRVLAAPTASSINSRMGSDSGKDCPSCSSCLRRFSRSVLPALRRRSTSLIRSRACSALRSSSSICSSGTDISPTSLSVAPPGALCASIRDSTLWEDRELCPYSPECVEAKFSEVRIGPVHYYTADAFCFAGRAGSPINSMSAQSIPYGGFYLGTQSTH